MIIQKLVDCFHLYVSPPRTLLHIFAFVTLAANQGICSVSMYDNPLVGLQINLNSVTTANGGSQTAYRHAVHSITS